TTEEKVDTSKALDASLVDTESSRTYSKEQDTSSRSGNDADDDDTDIRPIYDEELMAEVKHDIDVIETINIEFKYKVAKLLKENESLKKNYKELFDSIKITRDKTTEHTTFLIATNDKFKAQLQEKGFAITALKIKLRKSTGNSVNTKFAKSSILGKPMSQPFRNQSAVRQPTKFKSERPRFSKPQCDSQVDVHNDLSKPVTTYYFPKEREVASAKPHHMIASRNSRISRNSKPSLLHSARSKSTANGSKPMPRRNTQTSRNWPATKNSFVTTKTVPIAEHPRNSRNDSCVTKFLKEVNSRARVPSKKTTNRNKPVEQIVGLRWVSTGKILSSSTTNVDTEPLNGSNADITNDSECEQTLNLSTGLVPQRQKASDYDNPDPVPQRKDVSSSADADVPSQQQITVRLQAAISFPQEAEVERLLAKPTPPPSPLASLSPPSAEERLARCTALSVCPSPPPVPSPLLPSSGCPTQIQTLKLASTQALIDAVTAAIPSPPLPLPPPLYIPPPVERLLAMPTPSPSPLTSLSPPSVGERLARCTAPAALPSPPLLPPLHMPPPVDRRDDIPETEMPPRKRLCLSTIGFMYEVGESSTARPTGGRGIEYGFFSTLDAEARRRGIREVGRIMAPVTRQGPNIPPNNANPNNMTPEFV
nr:hypothetical protein [Tanacetum cinerariifolium]